MNRLEVQARSDRKGVISSVNAWVGTMRGSLSPDAADRIFWTAVRDILPDVSEGEAQIALAELGGFREAWMR